MNPWMIKTANFEYLNPASACPAQGLYSHMTRVKAGDMYYMAGQLAVGASDEVMGAGDFDVLGQKPSNPLPSNHLAMLFPESARDNVIDERITEHEAQRVVLLTAPPSSINHNSKFSLVVDTIRWIERSNDRVPRCADGTRWLREELVGEYLMELSGLTLVTADEIPDVRVDHCL